MRPFLVKAVIFLDPSIIPVFFHSSGRRISTRVKLPSANIAFSSELLILLIPTADINSTSKSKVELAGITDIARLPYPISAGITSLRCSPGFIPTTPTSQPLITDPAPRVKLNGLSLSLLESNLVPSVRVPV